jgi:hypothetical protein
MTAIHNFEIRPIAPPETLIDKLSAIDGPLDLYCWYEGAQGLPKIGADFWKEKIFAPLLAKKKDAFFNLYSLKGWDFQKKVSKLSPSSPIGNAINELNLGAIKCIYAFDFFKYCQKVEGPLYEYIKERMPKEWLTNLSVDFPKKGVTVGQFFENQKNVFDSLKDQDVSLAYSHLQYIEGYYLIRNSVEKALAQSQKSVKVAFVLPNDEGKYYVDFQKDVEKMLELEFGFKLSDITISISMHFFQYGKDCSARPYIDREKNGKMTPKEISSHFSLLNQICDEQEEKYSIPQMPRDMYHKLND